MPSTPILGITQVSTSQNGKETTINDAILALENATNAKLEVSLAAGNVTLTGTEATRNFIFKAVGATAARELLFPAAVNGNPYDRVIVVRNESGHGLTVRYTTSGLTTVTIPDGESRLISADAATGMDVAAEPPSVISFLSLTDAPEAYTAQAGKFLAVNVAENALEFVTGAQFPTLADNAGKYLTVNGSATGVVWTAIPDTFLQLTDTPNTFTGQAGKLVRVNSAATGLEFITPEETEAVTYVSAQRWRILTLEPGIWPENPPGLDPSDPSYITPTEQVGFGEIVFLDQDGVAIDTTGGTASASNQQSGFEADQAFNGIVTTGDGWRTEASYTGVAWIEYEFAGEIAPRRVSLTPINGSPQFGPMRFLIQYWDGSAWISMGDRTPAPWETGVPQIFRINGVPLVVLPEAPVNGSIYGRMNGAWTKINAEVVSTSVILYDLDGSHVWQYRRFTNAGTKTIFIRTEAAHSVPADGEWFFYNATGGALTISTASGVTVNPPVGGSLVVPARGTVRLKRVTLDTYDLFGDTVSTESGGELPPLAGNANRLLSVLADESGTAWITAPVTYTDEQARDAVGAALVAGTNVTINVNDAANTITIAATGIGLDVEEVRDTIAATLVAGTNIGINVNDALDTITLSTTALDAEGVRDTIGATLIAGSNVSINVNDAANTITIASSMDQEVIRDTVAATLVAGSNILITHDDAANTITIDAIGGGGGGGVDAESVRDLIGATLSAGANVSIVVDDVADTVTISATTDPEVVRDTIGAALVAGSNITITPNDGADTITVAASMDQEVIRDTVAAALVAGTNVVITHNDAANTITIDASGAGTDPEIVRDTMAAALVAGSNVTITPNDLGDTITIAATGTDAEIVRDTIGSALVAGSNVTIAVNDAANTITISAAGTDAEIVRDTIGAALTSGTGISIAVDDASDTITISSTVDAEFIRDTIGSTLTAGSNVSLVVDDAANTITISAATDPEVVRDTIADALVAGTNITIDRDDAANTITINSAAGGSTDPEVVRDTIAAALVAGTNVTIDVDDVANTITINSSGSGGGGSTDPEIVRDTIAAALVAGSGIGISHDDAGNNITITATGVLAGGAQTPSIRATGDAINFSSNTVNVPYPSGSEVGDTVIIFTSHGWDPNTPAGWTQLDQSIGTNINGATFMRVLNAADISAGSVTLNYDGSFGGVAQAITIVGSVSPRSVSVQRSPSLATSNPFNNTNTSTGDLLLGFFGSRSNTVNTLPAGWTTRASSQNTNASSVFGTLVSPGTSYTGTATASGTGIGIYTSLVSIVAPNGGNGVTQFLPIVTISDTTYDLPSNMAGRYLRFTATTDKVLNVRADSVHPMPAEVEWHIRNVGAGSLTIIPGGGVTINAPAGGSLIVPSNGVVTLKRTGTDIYDLAGSTFNGAGGVPYTLPFAFTGRTLSAETLLLHVFAEAVVFPAEFSGSTGRIGTAATANSTFSIRKNETAVGSIVVTPAGGITFASLSGLPVSFASGDLLTVVSPDPADTTLANCAFNLRGARI